MSEDGKSRGLAPHQGSNQPSEDDGKSRVRRTVVEQVAASFQAGPVLHPIFQKIEPEHVNQILENSRERQRDLAEYRKGAVVSFCLLLAWNRNVRVPNSIPPTRPVGPLL